MLIWVDESQFSAIFINSQLGCRVPWWVGSTGIVKFALESGASLVPVYGFGHSELWTKLLETRQLWKADFRLAGKGQPMTTHKLQPCSA